MRVLIADESNASRNLLRAIVQQNGWYADTGETGSQALAFVESSRYDVVLVDLNLPELDGFELLRKVRAVAPGTKAVLIGSSLGVREAVQAMKLGASYCLVKPLRPTEVVDVLKKIAASAPASPPPSDSNGDMVAVSPPMRQTKALLSTLARSKSTTVLITGETGTGKEVVARRLHRVGERCDKPFVAVNCSAIPASLVESELFGHERGAFTDARATRKGHFEMAADGTIFLDEIGDLSLELQGKLLRVLQERTFMRVGGSAEIPLLARVVAATNSDLVAAVESGRFREDLYYRLAVVPIFLPPLRERVDDILPLAQNFIRHFAGEMGCEPPELTDAQCQQLLAHPWAGNVRELRNVIERFVLMGGQLQFITPPRKTGRFATLPALAGQEPGCEAVNETERKMIYDLLFQKLFGPETARKQSTASRL